MPVKESAKKRMRSSKKRHDRNVAVKSEIKTLGKKFDSLIKTGDQNEAETVGRHAMSRIDRASTKRIFHSNTASRMKSHISRKLHLKAHPDK